MERTAKAAAITELQQRFARMSSAVFLDFTGMSVAEVTKLRDVLREKGVEYRVVKNTLVKKALAAHPWASGLDLALRGMTGVAWSYEEPSSAARALKDFRKDNEKLKIKAGLLEGTVLGPQAVDDQLATLPSKDEMRAKFLATLNAPAQQFVSVLAAPARNMVGVLAAKQRKAEGG